MGGETTESSMHFITQAPYIMKCCHARHLLLQILNYPSRHLEVRFPASESSIILYGLLLDLATSAELNLVILNSAVFCNTFVDKQIVCYL